MWSWRVRREVWEPVPRTPLCWASAGTAASCFPSVGLLLPRCWASRAGKFGTKWRRGRKSTQKYLPQAARDAAMPPASAYPYEGEKSPVDALRLSSIIDPRLRMAQRDAGGAKNSRAVLCGQRGSEVTVTTGSSPTSGCTKKLSGGKRRGSAGRNFLGREGNHHHHGRFPKREAPAGWHSPKWGRTAARSPALWGQELFWDRATRVPASPTPPRTSSPSGGPSSIRGRPPRGPSAPQEKSSRKAAALQPERLFLGVGAAFLMV